MASNAPHDPTALERSVQLEPTSTASTDPVVMSDVAKAAGDFRPSDRVYWQQKVLSDFDFTVDSRKHFNVATGMGQRSNALAESFAYWRHLKTFFRPSQFGYLRKIQYGELGLEAWPETEDPFTLYQDLVLLKKLVRFDGELQTDSDGEQFVSPVMLNAPPENTKQSILVLCGFVSELCPRVKMTKTWSGFEKELATRTRRRRRQLKNARNDEAWECMSNENDDLVYKAGPFPYTTRGMLDDLQEIVYEHMTAFRRIKIDGFEEHGPAFYIGQSKSNRWLGFCGQAQY